MQQVGENEPATNEPTSTAATDDVLCVNSNCTDDERFLFSGLSFSTSTNDDAKNRNSINHTTKSNTTTTRQTCAQSNEDNTNLNPPTTNSATSDCNNSTKNLVIESSTKISTKSNGLKNRIIQRPPPLILDKVSNFYTSDQHSSTQQQQLNQESLNHDSATSNKSHNAVTLNQQNNTKGSTSNKSTHTTSLIGESINIQSNSQGNSEKNAANHKFWASLNENASRNKALAKAIASNKSAPDSKSHNANITQTKDIQNVPETVGADLIISHRSNGGEISTSRVVSSAFARKLSHQSKHSSSVDEKGSGRNIIEGHQEPASLARKFHKASLQVDNETQRQQDVSNNSNDPDFGGDDENDGGNLIGVDILTSPSLDRVVDTPKSTTSNRSRAKNPFLEEEDDNDENEQQPSLDAGADQEYLRNRPASFIAATDRLKGANHRDTHINQVPRILESHIESTRSDDSNLSQPTRVAGTKTIQGETSSTYMNHQMFYPINQRDSYNSHNNNFKMQQNNFHSESHCGHLSNQSDHNLHPGYSVAHQEPFISIDSASTICQPPPSATMYLPNWTEAVYELNNAILESSSVAGGAENGQFIHIIESGDIILELDQIKVSGSTLIEFNELVESKQFHLLKAVHTKHSRGLSCDLKQYLSQSFPKDSEDRKLQNFIRENIYRCTIPCTTRSPKSGEVDKVDYFFLTREQFVELDNRNMLLECGVYGEHYYGTLKPLCDLNSVFAYQPTIKKEVPDNMQQLWDSNHPAIVNKNFTHTISDNASNDTPLYENHAMLKMNAMQQYSGKPFSQFQHNSSNANQNGMPLPPIPRSSDYTSLGQLRKSDIVTVDYDTLPPGWERIVDQTHGVYYFDHNTHRTQYERPYEVELTKGSMGLGFTLVETDGGLLLVRSIIPGGPAYTNGTIQPGDILVSAMGISVTRLQHTDIARLFSTFVVGDRVRLTFARGAYPLNDNLIPSEYLFSNGTNGDPAVAVNSSNYIHVNQSFEQSPYIQVDQEFEYLTVRLMRGDQGFGFTISDSIAGQKVRKIQNNDVCSDLKQGDVLVSLNGEDITQLSHKEVVERLKKFLPGHDVTLTVKRKKRFRSKTPMAMHTDVNSEYSLGGTPQRNCKTPSLDGLVLRRQAIRDSVQEKSTIVKNSLQDSLTPQQPVYHNPHPSSSTATPLASAQNLINRRFDALHPVTQVPSHPIYGIASKTNEDFAYVDQRQEQSLPPLPSYSRIQEFNFNQPVNVRPASIPVSSVLLEEHSTNTSYAPKLPPPPVNFGKSNSYGLPIIGNPNSLIMQNQAYQTTANQPDDHQMMPLYSNSDVISNESYKLQATVQPVYVPSFYTNEIQQNNYYVNNDEVASRCMQYSYKENQAPGGNQFTFSQSTVGYDVNPTYEDQDEFEYHQINLDRESTDSNWGIRLIGGAEVDRAISIGSIVFGGAASKNGNLKSGDEIITINGVNVVGATHQHVVELISSSSNRASLVVRRKKFAEACDVVLTRNLDEGFGFVIISSGNCALIGRIIEGSPADRCQQLHVRDRIIAVNGRYITPNMQHPEIVNMIKECGSTLRLRIIPVDCYTVELIKSAPSDNFGFSMRGGSEYDAPLYILRVAPNGLARDLLNVGDQIIEINNISTVGMTHQQAATIIKYSDPIVKLKLRRNYVTPPSLLVDSPRALQKFSQVTAEIKTVSKNPSPNNLVDSETLSSCPNAVSVPEDGDKDNDFVCQQNQVNQIYLRNHPSSMNEQAAHQASNLGFNLSLPLYAT